jgi:hypothetical protein
MRAEISAAGGINCRGYEPIKVKKPHILLAFSPWHGVC